MFYNEKYIYYRCDLSFNNPDSHKIKNAIVSILGQPQDMGLLHPFFVLDEKGNEDGEGFQLKLTFKNLEKLQKKCKQLNISFGEVFERDWRHIHLDYHFLEEELEGMAYEYEDHWKMYYEGGSLNCLPEFEGNNFFIQKIYKKDINCDTGKIHSHFEKWIIENITRKTLK